jgi:predicted ATP-dependent serine protease
VIVPFSEVSAEPVDFIWPGRIARGNLTLLVGNPGEGKSTFTLDVVARCSTGSAWPDGGTAPKGASLLLSAEDGPGDTILPRLQAFGADLAQVHLLKAIRDESGERTFSLDGDLSHLETAMVGTRATLVIVDPLSAYLGRQDSYKDAEIRRVLTPLAALAEKHRVAIIGILHLTKDSQRRALYRVLGSVGFVAAARNVLAVGPDPDDE